MRKRREILFLSKIDDFIVLFISAYPLPVAVILVQFIFGISRQYSIYTFWKLSINVYKSYNQVLYLLRLAIFARRLARVSSRRRRAKMAALALARIAEGRGRRPDRTAGAAGARLRTLLITLRGGNRFGGPMFRFSLARVEPPAGRPPPRNGDLDAGTGERCFERWWLWCDDDDEPPMPWWWWWFSVRPRSLELNLELLLPPCIIYYLYICSSNITSILIFLYVRVCDFLYFFWGEDFL